MNKYLKIALRSLLFVCVSTLTTWRSVGQNSLYTGQAPIGIPLYTVSDGKTQIPIGLNYNASGIKPNEHPGWVGQNWNLQAGGFVARKVNGLPDDLKADFTAPMLNGRTVTVKGFYFNYNQLNMNSWDTTATLLNTLIGNFDRYMQLQKSDTEPDEFYFSLPSGASGSFLLNEKGEWVFKGSKVMKVKLMGFSKVPFQSWQPSVYPYDPLYPAVPVFDCIKDTQNDVCVKAVSKYSTTFQGFIVTDDAGTEYTFGGDSTSISYSIPLLKQYYTHWKAEIWHLTKVKPIGGQDISLKYEEFNEKFNGKDVGGRFNTNMLLTAQKGSFCVETVPTNICVNGTLDTNRMYSGELLRPVYLKKIESIRDSVIFIKSRSVELEYPKKLYSAHYTNWNQWIRFFQRKTNVLGQIFDYTSLTANAWSPNTQNENWYTTDSLDKYLNNLAWVKLDRIKIYSKVAGESHAEIEYILRYNNSNKIYTYQSVGNKIQRTGGYNERIRLDTIAQVAGGKSLVYKLDYYKNDTIPQPQYFDSNGLVDHWGYLNKKKYKVTDLSYYDKREATKSIEVARIGTLKSITLPTGGKTIYDFEQNTYSKIFDMGIFKTTTENLSTNSLTSQSRRRRAETLYSSVTQNGTILINAKYGSYKLLFLKQARNNYRNFNFTERINGVNFRKKGLSGLYVDSVKIDTVGGLRIKSIKSINDNGSFIGKTTYSYDENHGKSNTIITSGILDYRFFYELQYSLGWFGNRYLIDGNTNTSFDAASTGSESGKFFASNGFYNPPVTYSEVTEKRYDNSYTTFHFTNFYSKVGGEHMDEVITKSSGFSEDLFQPIVDKSFERGRIILIESFRSDGKQVTKTKTNYENISQDFVKNVVTNSSFMGVSTSTTVNGFNFLINIVANVAIGVLTGGSSWVVQVVASAANPVPFILPTTSTNSYMHFSEYATAKKIYTYNYETSSDSTWTFDYTDPTKKFVTVNNYKYNTFGQLRELKRVQNDGLELLTNNKYVKDYDFQSIINGADYSTCTSAASACQVGCINSYPNQDDAAICQAQCGDQEASCRQIIVSNLISNPSSKNLYKMQMKNMIGYPVESIVKRKNINTTTYKVLGGTLNFYGEFNANGTLLYAPQSILKMKQTQTNATADTSKLDASGAFVYDQTRYTVKTFETTPSDGYGAFGNLTKYMGRDGVSNTMTHNAMNYPISKNIGITYGGNEFYSTMEYAPILGMIKTADQNNRKIRNRYDEFNRLRSVSKTLNESGTDNDYLLKLYNYHYFNDNSDITISDFVVGGCNGDSPASCTLQATLAPNSFVEMKVGSGLATTLTGSFDAGANSVADVAKYTWINPAGTVSTTAAYTIPALTATNLPSVLGVYYYKVEKGGCQACLKFTISKKTTATDPDLLAEEDK